MFINPNEAIENGWILFPEWMSIEYREKCIQPNALDITADVISKIVSNPEVPAFLSETQKQFHQFQICSPDSQGFIDLESKEVYDVHSDFYVSIPTGVAAELTIRSTLNRAGLALNSGIWDSGYVGHLGMIIYNRSGLFKLALHTRVCQIKFIRSDSVGLYAGGYNHSRDTLWRDETLTPLQMH